ncbi:Beta-apo-4'-carotenal oxygenase [Grifola frondosa]|uniref:Beta-apo-4'-carotenal oxygenase n=1 Tax=Grifola frondosa TaxID=5627 RepID=A0A1C7MQU3_GRIFR|nr:Beta-apo-4'-carotenal oxygenase [Grifola frondosa]
MSDYSPTSFALPHCGVGFEYTVHINEHSGLAPSLDYTPISDIDTRSRPRTSEITAVASSALHAAEHLDEWAKPDKPEVPAWRSSWDATAYKNPKGLALIIAPWNYPFITLLDPSRRRHICRMHLNTLIPMPTSCERRRARDDRLLTLRWAHIFYTGGVSSPIIIDPNFDDLDLAAKRILNGKLQNSGQLCITPDYALVPRAKVDAFIASLKKAHDAFLPNGPLHKNVELSKIVTPSHTRASEISSRAPKGKIVSAGSTRATGGSPTIVKDVPVDDALMENPIPLVVYAFTNSEEVKNKLLETTQSGAVVLNDTFSHLAGSLLRCTVPTPSDHFKVTEIALVGREIQAASFDTFTQVRMYMNLPPSEESRLSGRYRPFDAEKLDATLAAMQLKIPDV